MSRHGDVSVDEDVTRPSDLLSDRKDRELTCPVSCLFLFSYFRFPRIFGVDFEFRGHRRMLCLPVPNAKIAYQRGGHGQCQKDL